jgi:hypothetical protein
MKKLMAPGLAAAMALLLALLLSGTVLAQSEADAEHPEPSAYLTLNLKAGFVLDPFLVSLNGGGGVDASTLDPACVGWINDQPVLTTEWEGSADAVTIFFYSDTDSTLVVKQPDGTYACADDVSENLLDPELTLTDMVTGTYELWVGSFDEGHLIPGLLVITARDDVSVTSFEPGSLVKRGSIAAEVAPPSDEEIAATEIVSDTDAILPDGIIDATTGTLTATVTSTGTVPAFLLGSADIVCSGLVADYPDYILAVQGEVENLRIFFEGDQDATLSVVRRDGEPWCNDEAEEGANSNPHVEIAAPAEGLYGIFVGRFDEEVPVTGNLTITTDPQLEQVELAPAGEPSN